MTEDNWVGIIIIAVVILIACIRHFKSPKCNWCNSRHCGRCMYNPRAGNFFANINDSHFDYNDPNK